MCDFGARNDMAKFAEDFPQAMAAAPAQNGVTCCDHYYNQVIFRVPSKLGSRSCVMSVYTFYDCVKDHMLKSNFMTRLSWTFIEDSNTIKKKSQGNFSLFPCEFVGYIERDVAS